MNMLKRFKKGGFKTLSEALEPVSKIRESGDPITNGLFDVWWDTDGTKKGLLELIKKLKL